MDYLSSFINNFENVFQSLNIYRSVIIIHNDNDNDNEKELIIKLKEKDHLPIIINNIDDINNYLYNYRLFIIKDISLLNFINKKYYNFIAIY